MPVRNGHDVESRGGYYLSSESVLAVAPHHTATLAVALTLSLTLSLTISLNPHPLTRLQLIASPHSLVSPPLPANPHCAYCIEVSSPSTLILSP